MKRKYMVHKGKYCFRRATVDDNLDQIAELIYYTDPYIYPFWFKNNLDEAREYLKTLMLKQNTLFCIDNIYIAIDKIKNEIVGVLCAIDKSVDLSYDYEEDRKINNNYKFTIENYIEPLELEIEESQYHDYVYISNICVKENQRGKKIGSYLLGYFISQLEKEGFKTFGLDCLLHNLRAKNLYHSFGFKEMKEIVGFDGTDYSKVEVVSFLRKKGNYYPQEFQVSFLDRIFH